MLAGRAAWENAKDATVDTGRYLAGRAGAVANGDNRSTGMYLDLCVSLCSSHQEALSRCLQYSYQLTGTCMYDHSQ